jgi:hypothetical protein
MASSLMICSIEKNHIVSKRSKSLKNFNRGQPRKIAKAHAKIFTRLANVASSPMNHSTQKKNMFGRIQNEQNHTMHDRPQNTNQILLEPAKHMSEICFYTNETQKGKHMRFG